MVYVFVDQKHVDDGVVVEWLGPLRRLLTTCQCLLLQVSDFAHAVVLVLAVAAKKTTNHHPFSNHHPL